MYAYIHLLSFVKFCSSCVTTTGLWAFLYFVGFCYMSNQWSKAEDLPPNIGTGNIKAAIAFSLFSILTWVSILFSCCLLQDFWYIYQLSWQLWDSQKHKHAFCFKFYCEGAHVKPLWFMFTALITPVRKKVIHECLMRCTNARIQNTRYLLFLLLRHCLRQAALK